MSQHPFALYNPALLPPTVLLEEFTARRPMLETVLGVIRGNAPGHPPQHCLLIGARGMGKTTTLWAIAHRVNRDPELAGLWQPVVFDEESRRVGDLADFWLEAIRQWEFAAHDTADRAGKLLTEAPEDIEKRAEDIFTGLVGRSGKRALLLIDNLNDLLGSIRDPEPLHRLRAFLMQDSGVMIIGAAVSYFDQVTSVDQPFYDFFRPFELKPLSLDEMHDCLMSLARTRGDAAVEKTLEQRGGSVRALHLFTGGNPRLVKTFYRLLRDGLNTDIRADLERLLDEFTPYFKSIVDALPVQQQRIFDAVALAWDPVEVARLAVATRLPSNQVSAQLRALIKTGLIREAAGPAKRKAYLLSDRFSNIHYLMRHGRAARNRLDWFVATVRILFPDREATEVLARLAYGAAECGPEGMRDAQDLLHSAFNRSDSDESRRQLLDSTLRESWDSKVLESLDSWFITERAKIDFPEMEIITLCKQMPADLRKRIGYEPAQAEWWFEFAEFLNERKQWTLVQKALRKAIDLDPTCVPAWNNLGNLFCQRLNLPKDGEQSYRKAIELDPTNAKPWNNLGNVLSKGLNRLEEAEQAYRRAISLDPAYASPWSSLGRLISHRLNRHEEALEAYRKAIEIDPANAHTWYNLGVLLSEQLNRPEEAEEAYRRAINLDEEFAEAWFGLGHALDVKLNRPEEAEQAYRRAIELDATNGKPWHNLGNLLSQRLGRPKESEQAYRKAIQIDPKLARPWISLADVLVQKPENVIEARHCLTTGLPLEPNETFARRKFSQICADHAEDWRAVLPALARWCVENPKVSEAFDFTVDGFLRHARLTSPKETLALLEGIPDASPFETVRDALVACDDRDHLHRLAPERQAVAVEMMRRIRKTSE